MDQAHADMWLDFADGQAPIEMPVKISIPIPEVKQLISQFRTFSNAADSGGIGCLLCI